MSMCVSVGHYTHNKGEIHTISRRRFDMRTKQSGDRQKPNISVGSVLSIGKVVKICYNGVDIENRGNEFFVSRTAIEKVYEDDRKNDKTNNDG